MTQIGIMVTDFPKIAPLRERERVEGAELDAAASGDNGTAVKVAGASLGVGLLAGAAIGGAIGGWVGAGVGAGILGIIGLMGGLGAGLFISDNPGDRDRIVSEGAGYQIALWELTQAEDLFEIGPVAFNRYTDAALRAFDHNGDGKINLAPGQPLTGDERMRLIDGGPPTKREDLIVPVPWEIASATGADDGSMTRREIALAVLNAVAETEYDRAATLATFTRGVQDTDPHGHLSQYAFEYLSYDD